MECQSPFRDDEHCLIVGEYVCACDHVYVYSYMCMYTDVYKTAATVIGQDTNGLTDLQS